jgi:arylsulfatase A-like enzyme
MKSAFTASIIGLAVCLPTMEAAGGPPNIIMILADDLGWNDTSINGSTFYRTPQLERLAARGMRFTNAYTANPLCSPTRASILTGQYPARLRFTTPAGHLEQVILDPIVPATAAAENKLCEPQSRTRLPNETITYAETLKTAGYATAFMGKWHLGRDPYIPENQGFDTVIGGHHHASPPGGYFAPFSADSNLPASPAGTHIDDLLADQAVSFINANADGPFLLNLWFYGVHAPFECKTDLKAGYEGLASADGRQRCPTMGAMVQTMDTALGRVLDRLDTLGIADNTIIIFYADNGGNMYNWADNSLPTHNWPLRQGKASIHDGGTRVPCVIVWPGRTAPASTNEQIVSSVDLYPTILQMAGLSPDPGAIVDGASLIPALDGGGVTRDTAFCHYPHSTSVTGNRAGCWVRQGKWKLIRFFHDNPDKSHRHELYDLSTDPGEQTNLAALQPALVTQLDALISQHLTDTATLIPVPNPAYDPVNTGWNTNEQCRGELTGGFLQITSSGFLPEISSNTDLSSLPAPASVRIHMASRSFGNGRVSWRLPGQTGFPAGQSSDFTVVHDDTRRAYDIPIPPGAPIEALAIQPGSDASQSDIHGIDLRDAAGKLIKSWSWIDTDGDGKFDGDEQTLGRNPGSSADMAFEFGQDGDFEGWTAAKNITAGEVSAGSLRGTATNGDPQLQHTGFDFPASGAPAITVRLKAAENASVQLYFATSTFPSYTGQFLSQSYTGAGAWQSLVFNLASHASYTGNLNSLRLDPIGKATAFEIDWIRASDGDAEDDGVPDGDETAGDADADGLQNHLDPDSDNDDQPDLLEFLAGSDLLSSASRFSIAASMAQNPDDFLIEFSAIPGRIYTLWQWSESTGQWLDSTQAGPFPAPLTHRFTIPTTGNRGIFRVGIRATP